MVAEKEASLQSLDPDVAALIDEEFLHASKHLKRIILLRSLGYGVTEIAPMYDTYRNEIYRALRKAQAHMSRQ